MSRYKYQNIMIGKCDDCDREDVYVFIMLDRNICALCSSTEFIDYDEYVYAEYDDFKSYENNKRR